MEPLAVGQTLEVTVTRLENYGAWIDSQGRAGLIVIPEVSWSRISHPRDVLTVGQSVTVKILHVGSDGKFSASLRAMYPELNPWRDPSLFAVGTEFTAPVARVMNYGCFIELQPEVWGLLHRDRWSRSYEVADRVAVRVESVDPALRKIELSKIHLHSVAPCRMNRGSWRTR